MLRRTFIKSLSLIPFLETSALLSKEKSSTQLNSWYGPLVRHEVECNRRFTTFTLYYKKEGLKYRTLITDVVEYNDVFVLDEMIQNTPTKTLTIGKYTYPNTIDYGAINSFIVNNKKYILSSVVLPLKLNEEFKPLKCEVKYD